MKELRSLFTGPKTIFPSPQNVAPPPPPPVNAPILLLQLFLFFSLYIFSPSFLDTDPFLLVFPDQENIFTDPDRPVLQNIVLAN
jgi:hypothetical protein